MKSAYLVLGVPGNASSADIEYAFARATELYPPRRLANEDGAVDTFNQIKTAYEVLRDPSARAAHDRKLAGASQPRSVRPVTVIHEEESPARKFLLWGFILTAVLFAGGFYVQQRTARAREAEAALEIARLHQAEQEAKMKAEEASRAEAERAAAKAKADADDRRFAAESLGVAARANAERARQEAMAAQMERAATAQAQRDQAAARMREQREAAEARMRFEADKRLIRQRCYQLYGRYDC